MSATNLFLRPFLAAVVAGGFLAAVHGQPVVPTGKLTGSQMIQQRRALFLESAPLFIGGNGNAGEQRLLSISPHRPNSALWHYDAGLQLYTMALYLDGQRHYLAARDAVTRALSSLDTSAKLAQSADDKKGAARAYEYMARIYDVFLADVSRALEKLKEGARMDPTNGKIAREVERLGHAEKTLKPRKNGR